MEFVTIFREFGYPGAITGFLLWIMATKIERINASMQKLIDETIKLQNDINRLRDELGRTRGRPQ